MTKTGRWNKTVRILKNIWILCVMAAVFRRLDGFLLRSQGIRLRSWLEVTLDLMTWFGIPVLTAVILFTMFLSKKETSKENAKGVKIVLGLSGIFGILLLTVYLAAAALVFAFRADSIYEKERKLPYGILEGVCSRELFSIENQYRYYEKAGLFTKKEFFGHERIVKAVLEEKYQENFCLTDSEVDSCGYYWGKGYFTSLPDMTVHVSAPPEYSAYWDDRKTEQTWYRAQEYLKETGSTRRLEAVRTGENRIIEIRLYCAYEEIRSCAQDAAELITGILRDPFFTQEYHGSSIKVVCGEEADGQNETWLYFGNTYGGFSAEGLAMDYYADYENVRKALEEAFFGNPHAILNDAEKNAAAEQSMLTPEGSFRQLFEQLFADQGYEYQVCYNAKGNFYALLEEGVQERTGEMLMTQHTVVYDRESKNGKCQLFVEYLDHLKTDGQQTGVYSTDILEFYAVDMLTGEVCAADKTAWEQIGNAKYWEMTGE